MEAAIQEAREEARKEAEIAKLAAEKVKTEAKKAINLLKIISYCVNIEL